MDGNHIHSFGNKGKGKGEFNKPMHQVYYDGMVFVADWRNNRVQVLDVAKMYDKIAKLNSSSTTIVRIMTLLMMMIVRL